jgi:hypothetical protein
VSELFSWASCDVQSTQGLGRKLEPGSVDLLPAGIWLLGLSVWASWSLVWEWKG